MKNRKIIQVLTTLMLLSVSIIYLSVKVKNEQSKQISENNRVELEIKRTEVEIEEVEIEEKVLTIPTPSTMEQSDDVAHPIVSQPEPPDVTIPASIQKNYNQIKNQYPDFKGWIELPAFGISYPVFVNEQNPYKYERMTRDGIKSNLGEVGYVGTPGETKNVIYFGHSLSDNSGFTPIDKYPDIQNLTEEQRTVIIDHVDSNTRIEYTIVHTAYYPADDTTWFQTGFSSISAYNTYLTDIAGISDYTGDLVTLYTCKNSRSTIKTVLFCIPK